MPNPTTAAAWADYLATLDHHTVTRAERKKNMINALDAYVHQRVREALEEAEMRLEELNSEGEHDKDYHEGYSQAVHDAIAALRGGTG